MCDGSTHDQLSWMVFLQSWLDVLNSKAQRQCLCFPVRVIPNDFKEPLRFCPPSSQGRAVCSPSLPGWQRQGYEADSPTASLPAWFLHSSCSQGAGSSAAGPEQARELTWFKVALLFCCNQSVQSLKLG